MRLPERQRVKTLISPVPVLQRLKGAGEMLSGKDCYLVLVRVLPDTEKGEV